MGKDRRIHIIGNRNPGLIVLFLAIALVQLFFTVRRLFTGDMTGDGLPDIVLYNNPGGDIYIYKNEYGTKPRGKVNIGSGVNYSLHQ